MWYGDEDIGITAAQCGAAKNYSSSNKLLLNTCCAVSVDKHKLTDLC